MSGMEECSSLEFEAASDVRLLQWLDGLGRHPNTLIVCPEQTVASVLRQLRKRSTPPVHYRSLPGTLSLPLPAAGTLVLNDVGPFLPKAALERINRYLGLDLRFADIGALEAHLREIHAGFGPLTDAQWRHLAEHAALIREDGTLGLNYDQRLALPLKRGPIGDVDLWPVWDRIRCPVLVLRGAESDLLAAETAAEMARRGPCAEIIEIDGTGHAPVLMAKGQIEIVRNWLSP